MHWLMRLVLRRKALRIQVVRYWLLMLVFGKALRIGVVVCWLRLGLRKGLRI